MNCQNIINLIESLAVIIASSIVSISAYIGISSWRKEIKQRKEYDLAEEVLALFYEAKDIISFIRSPFGWSGEGKTRNADSMKHLNKKKFLIMPLLLQSDIIIIKRPSINYIHFDINSWLSLVKKK